MINQNSHKIITDLHAAVAAYKMPENAKNLVGSGELIVICGVTAAGKNTIADYLIGHGNYLHVVSHTTRKPRENHGVKEENGREYWFVEPIEMLEMINDQNFIEVKAIHGETCYGTSIEAVKNVISAGLHPIMEIDVQGALELTEVVPKLRPLFILPPTYEVWMQRLGSRGNISDGEKDRRFRSASMEIETALDHSSFTLLTNHEVEMTAREIMNGIDTSDQAQADRSALASELLETLRKM